MSESDRPLTKSVYKHAFVVAVDVRMVLFESIGVVAAEASCPLLSILSSTSLGETIEAFVVVGGVNKTALTDGVLTADREMQLSYFGVLEGGI